MFPQAAGQHFHPRPDALRPPLSVLKRKLHTASVSLPQVFDGGQLTGDVPHITPDCLHIVVCVLRNVIPPVESCVT